MLYLIAVWVGKFIILLSRLRGSAGSALPGLVVQRVYPNFIRQAAKQLRRGVVVVTGTNGKTTTTKLIAGILTKDNYQLVTNRTGSNMSRGIISALLEQSSWMGKLKGDTGLFEVDEAYMGEVASHLRPKVAVVLNLLRDQLDRYGELDRTATLIKKGLTKSKHLVLNADDPLVAKLGDGRPRTDISYFGAVSNIRRKLPSDELLHQNKKTPPARRYKPDMSLEQVLKRVGTQELKIRAGTESLRTSTLTPGVYNAYNAVAALSAATQMGVQLELATSSLTDIKPAYGRGELVQVGDKQLQILLVKNPAGFNQVITNFLIKDKTAKVLMAINDNIADGRDVSWLWDVDFEGLASHGSPVIVAGLRSQDLALRLKYAGVETRALSSLKRGLMGLLADIGEGQTGYIVPTYTAMLGIRKLLASMANLDEVWQ